MKFKKMALIAGMICLPFMSYGEDLSLQQKAGRGDAEVQFLLGRYYGSARGVPQDYKEAVKWYRLAAEQGHAQAQFTLGVCYYKGEGVPQDYKEAVKWCQLAAKQGHVLAQFNLGICYYNGFGVPQDTVQAYAWFSLAEEMKLEPAKESKAQLRGKMTIEQIKEGERLSQEYAEKFVKK